MDDMHCLVCGADVFSTDVESYAVTRWVPETESNVLVAVYCSNHQPHYHRSVSFDRKETD